MSLVANTPARFDEGVFDNCRFDVFSPKGEQMIRKIGRSITRRVACFNVDRDATTGIRYPTYDDQTIIGVLAEQSGSMPAFAVGVVMRQEAVLITIDGVLQLDQIKDGDKYFEVNQIEEHIDPDNDGFAFRVCHLSRLELYMEK